MATETTVRVAAPPTRWELALRQADYWAITFRRTWKGSAFSSFVAPVLYVAAMGVLLGGFISADSTTLEGATSYLGFVAPGLVAVHAFQTGGGEALWPVMTMFKWNKTHYAMIATPLSPRDLVNAHLAAIAVRLLLVCGVFLSVLSMFGVYHSAWGGVLALPVAVLTGLSIAAPIYAYTASLSNDLGLALAFRLGIMPMVLFSGAFFPLSNLPSGLETLAKTLPLWQGVDLIRMLMLGTVDLPWVFVHLIYLLALTVVGWWLAGRRLTARLVR
jgi:lipooligosaccharide transport system permease protein